MRARRIKKLRNRISKFKPYLVCETAFGQLFGVYDKDGEIIMADSFELARKRFVRYDERYHKERSEYHNCCTETDRCWGRLMVIDERGYKKFYR
jgi:hypothetical protein